MTVYAIIGGTGLTRLEGLEIRQSLALDTPTARRLQRCRSASTPAAKCCFSPVMVTLTVLRRTG